MFGVLNINKPTSWTSRDVVNRVQRLVRPAKAGHAGTLDPLATGVLVVCVGPATRLISYVQEMPKTYQATFLLGRESDSDDVDTDVRPLASPPVPTSQQIEKRIPTFLGRIHQRPPAYSAIKVKGERAYKLARQGQPVVLEPRTVEIYGLKITRYEYPTLEMSIRCGGGTYVRSLGRDLAESLETSAVMSALNRTAVGDFLYEDAVDADRLTKEVLAERLRPASRALSRLPRTTLTELEIEEVRNGRQISASGVLVEEASNLLLNPSCRISGRVRKHLEAPVEIAAVDENGNLVAILQEKRLGMLGPVRNFPLPE